MERRTKIVVTLGPAVDSKERIKDLIDAGMNVARLNCSHGDWEAKRRWIEWIREMSPSHGPVAILADLQGPKFRVGTLPTSGLDLVAGQMVTLGIDAQIPIHQQEILDEMDKVSNLRHLAAERRDERIASLRAQNAHVDDSADGLSADITTDESSIETISDADETKEQEAPLIEPK